MRFRHQIRPNFSFDQNNSRRSDDRERAARDWPEIERIIHHFDPWRSAAIRKRKSGCRRRGKNATQIRLKNAHLSGQLQRDPDFADANRVQPGRSSLRQALPYIDIVKSEALTKLFAITSSAKHFDEITRQKNQETDWPEQIVNEANHCGISECDPEPDSHLRIAERKST